MVSSVIRHFLVVFSRFSGPQNVVLLKNLLLLPS
jgi:hypothetical protein